MIYDIIGDIHGHADKLEDLLINLNYEMKDGFYQHNNRKAVFVGDFIDRGTQNRRVVEIVRGMVENKHAYGSEKESFPSDAVEEHAKIPFYETGNKPVFFGHYWMTGTPCLQQHNVCVLC